MSPFSRKQSLCGAVIPHTKAFIPCLQTPLSITPSRLPHPLPLSPRHASRHTPHACERSPPPPQPSAIRRRPRRADYGTHGVEPKQYVEPEEILLVPVCHGSQASAQLVRDTILQTRPDAVVVELCRSRSALMSPAPPSAAISGLASLRMAVERGSAPALVLRALLAAASRRKDGHQLQPGVEFVAAAQAANDVGACVVLGDRPLEVTLRRAWGVLGAVERVAFLAAALRGALFGTRVEELEEKRLTDVLQGGEGEVGAVEDLLRKFKETPRLAKVMQVLVDERDLYLAWSLKRSEAVKGRRTVVGVIGQAHVEGVLKACDYDDGYRRRDERPPLLFRDLI